MAPTKHDDKKPPATAAATGGFPSAPRTQQVINLSCRVNPARAGGRGGARGRVERSSAPPVAVLVHLAPDHVRADLLRLFYRRVRRRQLLRLRACLEALQREMARRRMASSEPLLRRVPGSTEDRLAAMMAQLTTTTTTTPAGGDRDATTVPATAPPTTTPPADQSSGIGEMFEKMAVSSED